MSKIICDSCEGEIKNNDDLIVTTKYIFLNFTSYHSSCYAEKLKSNSLDSIFISQYPINTLLSWFGILMTCSLLFVFTLIFFLLGLSPFISLFFLSLYLVLIVLPMIAIRLFVYYRYEKPFEVKK
jgi:hypothetical protein